MNNIKIENEYKNNVITLNSQQALLLAYEDAENMFATVSALGTVGLIDEIADDNYKENIVLNTEKECLHICIKPQTINNGDIPINSMIVGFSDTFFNNKDFYYIMEDTLINLLLADVKVLRIIITTSNGLAIKIDTAMIPESNDINFETKKISDILEIEITKILKSEMILDKEFSLNNDTIIYSIKNIGDRYDTNVYYLIDKENLENTRLIRLTDGEE